MSDLDNKPKAQILAERDSALMRLATAERVLALYTDALSVIAHHPGAKSEPASWMKAKALEALEKTSDAARGAIYAGITGVLDAILDAIRARDGAADLGKGE